MTGHIDDRRQKMERLLIDLNDIRADAGHYKNDGRSVPEKAISAAIAVSVLDADFLAMQASATLTLAEIVASLLPPDVRPEFWPPKPGQVWQDRNGDRWICAAGRHSYLVCLPHSADDGAEEIWQRFGPMSFVRQIDPTEEEVPF